jgi:hypothetical protein
MDSRLCKKKSLKRSRAGASLIGEHRWIPIKTRVCPGSALRQTARGDPEEALGRMAARPRAHFRNQKARKMNMLPLADCSIPMLHA